MVDQKNYNTAFDKQSTSVIKLDNHLTLYLREIDHLLALVCLVKEDDFDRQALVDFNIDCFRHGVKNLFEVRDEGTRQQETAKHK